jgi:hypothetical protein
MLILLFCLDNDLVNLKILKFEVGLILNEFLYPMDVYLVELRCQARADQPMLEPESLVFAI